MKISEIEKRIYELLRIKKFKKFVLYFSELVTNNNPKFRKAGHCYLDEKLGFEGLKDYKKYLKKFSLIHIIMLIIETPGLIFVPYPFFIIFDACFMLIHLYCLMLQRYNTIRINEAIEKYEELKRRRVERLKQKAMNPIKDLEKGDSMPQIMVTLPQQSLDQSQQNSILTSNNADTINYYPILPSSDQNDPEDFIR